MVAGRGTLIALLGLAGVASWMLVAGPSRLLGIDSGHLGMAMLVSTAWFALYAISRLPRDAIAQVSPGEWKAWVGLGFMVVAVGYFVSHLQVFTVGGPADNPHANRIGSHLIMLLIAWTVLSSVLKSRWQGEIEEDERDRQIAVRSQRWAHGAVSAYVIGLALLLAFSPADRLQWATHFRVGNLLVLGLMVASAIEHATRASLYVRDRI